MDFVLVVITNCGKSKVEGKRGSFREIERDGVGVRALVNSKVEIDVAEKKIKVI